MGHSRQDGGFKNAGGKRARKAPRSGKPVGAPLETDADTPGLTRHGFADSEQAALSGAMPDPTVGPKRVSGRPGTSKLLAPADGAGPRAGLGHLRPDLPFANENFVPHRPPRPVKSEGGRRLTIASDYKPAGDQPTAIAELVEGVQAVERDQVLLGVTGSGKTFTMAQVIAATQYPMPGRANSRRSRFPSGAAARWLSVLVSWLPRRGSRTVSNSSGARISPGMPAATKAQRQPTDARGDDDSAFAELRWQRGDRAGAAAYATHVMDVVEHYRWRWFEQKRLMRLALAEVGGDRKKVTPDLLRRLFRPSFDGSFNPDWQERYFDSSRPARLERLFWISEGEKLPPLAVRRAGRRGGNR